MGRETATIRGSRPQVVDKADEKKEETINLGDGAKIKHMLDDAAIEVITGSGYLEDYHISNMKILLGFLTVGVALIAQFWPGKYPDNWAVLAACVVAYSALSVGLTMYTSHVEGDAILLTKPPRVGGGDGLRVLSRMPRFSDKYSLEIADRSVGAKPLASMQRSVTRYFYSDGVMAEPQFKADVEALLEQYLAKKGS